MKADCSHQSYTSVPDGLPNKLEWLSLDGNKIASIKQSELNFPDLKVLNVRDNNITDLASDLFNVTNELLILDISGNGIKDIDSNIFQSVKSLREIKGLHVASLPNNLFANLPNLKKLELATDESFIQEDMFQVIRISF